MAMNSEGKKFALNLARDLTTAVLNNPNSSSFITNGEAVSEFFEVIYRKAEELIVENDSIT